MMCGVNNADKCTFIIFAQTGPTRYSVGALRTAVQSDCALRSI